VVIGGQGVGQTRRWLEMVEAKVNDCFESGLTITEAIAEPLPAWTESIALSRYEWERTVLHLYAGLETGNLPRVDKT